MDELTDKRVRLSEVARSDADDLIKANADSVSFHRSWVEVFTDQRGFDDYLSGLGAADKVGLVAREIGSGRIVGVINFSQIFRRSFQNAYLGYYGTAETSGRGLMTEAVRQALAYAFDELALHRIEANVQPENHRSLALIRRVGFRREGFSPRYLKIGGEWRDHERWAILSDEFDGTASRPQLYVTEG